MKSRLKNRFIGGPSARFKPHEIPFEWQWARLTDYAVLATGHTPSRAVKEYWNGGIPWVSLQDTGLLDQPEISTTAFSISEVGVKNSSARILPKGTVIFSRTATVGKSTVLGQEMATSQDFMNYICGDEIVNRYLVYVLRGMERTWESLKSGSAHSTIYRNDFLKLCVLLPPPLEQRKISALLASWDRATELTEKLVTAKQKCKQALMQHIFQNCTGSSTQLSKVLRRVRHPVSPQANSEYRQIGIRSHGKGIFHKAAVTGSSLGNKRVYEIKPDCFVFNVVFAWEQAVARTTASEIGMIASHRFPMYEPIDELVDIDFLLYFFKTKKGKHLLGLASPGGAGRNRTLSQAAFLKLKVFLPSKIEQTQQANILRSADQEISLLEHRIDLLKQQKKGLMQQLLTGKTRVKLPKTKRKK